MTSYLFHYFKGDKGQHALRSIVTGSAQLKFNKTNLRSLKLQIPPDNVLSKFELVTGSLLEKVDANCAQIRTLASLRNTLLPRLISGQLRLPEAEALLRDAA
jgi:type I restriction enzyme S subunit